MRAFAIAITMVSVAPRLSSAGELDTAGAIGVTTSRWAGDTGGGGSLKVGYFFERLPWLAPIFVGRVELVPVDERIITYFSLGAEARRSLGPCRGYLRLGVVHVHEESRSAFSEAPFQSILGVGPGIRHRAGGNLGIGVEVPFYRMGPSDLYVATDVGGTLFAENDRGPRWYVSATLGLGFRWGSRKSTQPKVARAS